MQSEIRDLFKETPAEADARVVASVKAQIKQAEIYLIDSK